MQTEVPTVHPAHTTPERFAQALISCGQNMTMNMSPSAWWGPPLVGALQVHRVTS